MRGARACPNGILGCWHWLARADPAGVGPDAFRAPGGSWIDPEHARGRSSSFGGPRRRTRPARSMLRSCDHRVLRACRWLTRGSRVTGAGANPLTVRRDDRCSIPPARAVRLRSHRIYRPPPPRGPWPRNIRSGERQCQCRMRGWGGEKTGLVLGQVVGMSDGEGGDCTQFDRSVPSCRT